MELCPVRAANLWELVKLRVAPEQEDFVATNTQSILEAYVTVAAGKVVLPFGLYHEGAWVGFLMIGYDILDPEDPAIAAGNYCLWRFMIHKAYQRQGLGKLALQLALDYIRTAPCGPADYCWLSYEEENTAAKALYQAVGFVENGERCDHEIVAVLKLREGATAM